MAQHEVYMSRCIELAQKGAGFVAPNPMVGAVLVYEDTIIGEGFHRHYGLAHAEVNCIESVPAHLQHLIALSTLYVSLEPCAHFGKTPPCADLIVRNKIPKVVIGCIDTFSKVSGKGIEKLKNAGIECTVGILEQECIALNKRFFTFHNKKRPFITLKWAKTADGFIGKNNGEQIKISNEMTNCFVQQLRSQENGILIGKQTAINDNPKLNVRISSLLPQPTIIVLDKSLQIPFQANIYNNTSKTIFFNSLNSNEDELNHYIKIPETEFYDLNKILSVLHQQNIQSVLVEGGAKILQSFINAGLWDEAIEIQNTTKKINEGTVAPRLSHYQLIHTKFYQDDILSFYCNAANT